jgi:chaperonin GroES
MNALQMAAVAAATSSMAQSAAAVVGGPCHAEGILTPDIQAQLDAFRKANTSGVTALDLRVVVKPDKAQERTAGGIILADVTREADKHAMQKATIISVGENAWEEAAERAARRGAEFQMPQVGDRVMIGKYAGVRFKGLDGEDYALLNDDDVIGRLAE